MSQAQTKIFTGILEDYTCGDDRCSFGIKKADGNFYDENITLEYDATGKPKLSGEFQDLIVKNGDNESLNTKYQGKKVTLTCSVKNNVYYVSKIEDASKAPTTPAKDNFTKATCKIYNNDGVLISICEAQTAYAIKDGEKLKEGKPIQNKNEVCIGKNCMKVKVDKDGLIQVYYLPNTTDAKLSGKIEGDKIYSCWKGSCNNMKVVATFKGDKNQAAVIAVGSNFFR